MKEAVTIFKSPELTASQEYTELRREGLQHIERLSSELWTDYNSHDPGITLLEVLCYAITDLGWRTRYDVKDLLADRSVHSPSDNKQFYTARDILTSSPVTVNDYRKLLIDIKGIKNAWIEPASLVKPDIYINHRRSRLQYEEEDDLEQLKIRGLYDIILELEHDSVAGDLNRYTMEIPLDDAMPLHRSKIIVDLPSWDRLMWARNRRKTATKVTLTVKKATGRYDFSGEVAVLFEDEEIRESVTLRASKKDIPLTQIRDQIKNHDVEEWYRNKINAALKIVHRTWRSLHRNRNLCEDFYQWKGIDVEDVGLCADIDVATDADLEQVLATVIHTVSRHMAPDVTFYTLQELLKNDIPVEEIFNGPALDHGFIIDKDLEAAQLKKQVNVSDLINLIMDMEGVVSIRSISLASSYKGQLVEKDAEWRLDITENRAPRLAVDKSKIVFYKDDIPFAADRDQTQQLLKDLQMAEREAKLSPDEQNDLLIPEGVNRNISDFTSIRVDLPDNYGVNRNGIQDPLTPARKARSAQLKAFLTLFDQLLANYLSQMANMKHLFSFDRTIRKTYFTQVLFSIPNEINPDKILPGSGTVFSGEDPPRIWIVLLHFIRFLDEKGFSPDVLHDREQMELLRQDFLANTELPDSEITQYLKYLDNIIESPKLFRRRRNRFLDHLLARFGEQFTDYVLLVHSTGDPEGEDRLIEDKIRFLEEAPQLSSERGKSYDYTDKNRVWDTDNVSGFKKRLCRLLGIRDYTRRSLICREADNFFDVYQDAAGKWRFRFRDDDGSSLLRSTSFPTKDACEQAIEKIKNRGGETKNYEFLISKNNRFYFNLLDEDGDVLGTGQLFITEESRSEGLKFITNKLGICNKEGFHLVEHILLRPEQKADPLLPVCLSKEGTGCPGFRDPYSFRVSLIVPYWPVRFRTMEFRRLFEKMARLELPAHIHVKICWVDEKSMENFEKAYLDWLNVKSRPESGEPAEAARKLIRVMAGIRSVYPVSKLHICSEEDEQNPILLDRSILGTIKYEEP